MNYHDFDDNEGCCLKCTEAHPGCLCFDCKCTQCDDYAEGGYNASGEYGGYCIQRIQFEEEAEAAKEAMSKNICVNYTTVFGNTLIQIRTIGPVEKANYAKLKPFLAAHCRYDFENKCYYVYSENWRFVRRLRFALINAGFSFQETLENENYPGSWELPVCFFGKIDICDCKFKLDCIKCRFTKLQILMKLGGC